jgi:hypothetical protein
MLVRRMRDHAHHGIKILLLLGKERAASCYSRFFPFAWMGKEETIWQSNQYLFNCNTQSSTRCFLLIFHRFSLYSLYSFEYI